jgi:DNA-binding NtrC family response regulator
VKLLRVLQEGEVDPVGGKRPTKVDVRIISATNKDLAKLVADGAFREDLFYRLNVFPIEAPPLRDRKEDLPALVQRFIARFNAEEGRTVRGASPTTMQMLMDFDWPGNVRQLENSVFRAVILCEGDLLHPEDFPQISGMKPLVAANDATPANVPVPANDHHVMVAQAALTAAFAQADETSMAPVAVFDAEGHLRQLEQIERDLIELAIDHYAGHMSEVARRLGIGRSTLYRKLREYGLEEKAVAEG